MISQRAKNIVPSATVEFSARLADMRRKGEKIIGLNVGEPDFPPPGNVRLAAIRAIAEGDGHSKYDVVPGLLSLREAICDKLEHDNGVKYLPSQICACTGAKQALQNSLMAIINPGDEVIIPSPCWVSYTELVKLADGVPVLVPMSYEDGYALDIPKIASHVTSRTKAVLLCDPNNPTGAVYTEKALQKLSKLAVEKNFYVISDEIYEKLVFGVKHISIASLGDGIRERTIIVNGFSKAYAMPGWRLGYTAAPADIARAINSIQGHTTSHPSLIAQFAGLEALRGPQDSVETMRQEYERRRDVSYNALSKMPGVSLRKPDGAFYLFPNIEKLLGTHSASSNINSSQDFAEYLLDETKVAVVFGEAFYGKGCIRLSYTASMKEVKEAMERIGNAIAKLANK